MSARLDEVAAKAVSLLGDDPGHARKALRAQFPEYRIDLLHERDAYDGTTSYDVVVRARGRSTLVVSLCPDRGLPYIARGSYRRGETDLVRVNADSMRVQDAMALADNEIFARRAIDALLTRQALDDAGLTDAPVSDADLQRAVDRFRRRHGLLTVTDTECWLREHGKTLAMLESALEDDVRVLMLRRRLFEAATQAELRDRLFDYDIMVVTSLDFPSARAAQAFHDEMPDDAALARAVADDGVVACTRRWRRFECPATVVCAEPGERVAPVDGTIHRLLQRVPAQPDDATRVAIRDRLFVAWLDEQRRDADIEWFWGTAAPATDPDDRRAR